VCLDVPSWYWDVNADAAGGGVVADVAFTLRWVPPAAAAVGAAVCACISGGVTCVGYANGQVVALVDKWQSPIWVWDEGGRSVRMFTRGSGFARTLTSIDRVTCLCMFGGCVVWGLGDGGVCVGRLATGECVRWVQRMSRDASGMISRLFVFPTPRLSGLWSSSLQ
jgi:hypothetical protein